MEGKEYEYFKTYLEVGPSAVGPSSPRIKSPPAPSAISPLPSAHSLSLSETEDSPPETSPPPVSVIRHVSPTNESPPTDRTLTPTSRRFSSNFTTTHASLSLSHHLDNKSDSSEQPTLTQSPSDTSSIDSALLHTIMEDTITSSHPSENKKAKKKGGRIVPSRYMSASRPHPPLPAVVKSKPPKANTTKSILKSSRQNPNTALSYSFTPSSMATSTPLVTSSVIDKSKRLDLQGSYMAKSSHTNATRSSLKTKTAKRTPAASSTTSTASTGAAGHTSTGTGPGDVSLLEMRLLQLTYLDVMSYKALKEQEETAQNQIHSLWMACENIKKENVELKKALEYESRTRALDHSLNMQLEGLEPLCSKLAEVQQQHSVLSSAIDSTRHELELRNILPPDEDELEKVLIETECKLGTLLAGVRADASSITNLATTSAELLATTQRESVEVGRVWKELSCATKMQLQETSLFYENKQRLQ